MHAWTWCCCCSAECPPSLTHSLTPWNSFRQKCKERIRTFFALGPRSSLLLPPFFLLLSSPASRLPCSAVLAPFTVAAICKARTRQKMKRLRIRMRTAGPAYNILHVPSPHSSQKFTSKLDLGLRTDGFCTLKIIAWNPCSDCRESKP